MIMDTLGYVFGTYVSEVFFGSISLRPLLQTVKFSNDAHLRVSTSDCQRILDVKMDNNSIV